MLRRGRILAALKQPRKAISATSRSLDAALPVATKIDCQVRNGCRVVAALRFPRGTSTGPQNERFLPPGTVITFSQSESLSSVSKEETSQTPRTNMLSWVQLILMPTADTPGTSLLLHFDSRRYVFGSMSEGTQRAWAQRKASITKMEHIFLSGAVNWANIGGMFGTILTLADVLEAAKQSRKEAGKLQKGKAAARMFAVPDQTLTIHGAQNLTYSLATSRHFIFRKGMPIRISEITEDPRLANPDSIEPDWEDENIRVWYITLAQRSVPDPQNDQETPRHLPSSPQSSQPSRKRGHDQMLKDSDGGYPSQGYNSTLLTEQEKADADAIAEVVKQMFGSDWSLDALVPTTLHQVQLPAKIFMRDDSGKIVRYDGPLPGEKDHVPDIPVLVRNPWPATRIETLPGTRPSRQVMSYIVRNQRIRGKFDPTKAEHLGIARQDYKRIAAGESLQGKDGITVTPEMVMGPPNEGQGFVVADIPDVSYVDSFMCRPEWRNEKIMVNVKTFYWILGPGLADDLRIQEFVKEHSKFSHIVSSTESSPNMLALESPATLTTKLHRIDPERFPLLQYSNAARDLKETNPLLEAGRAGSQMHMTPRFRFSDENLVPFPNTAHQARSMPDECLQLAQVARTKLSDPSFLGKIEHDEFDIPDRDTEIIPLGTGSALPSKYRNVSATLVRVPRVGNYLFDCGENTIGQLRRAVGFEEAAKILSNLRAIFISHLHADHHLGTTSIIKAWYESNRANPQASLTVACPTHMQKWLDEYNSVEDFGYSRLQFHIGPGVFEPHETTGLAQIETCLVDHCFGAMAGTFSWPSGLKIAYSGDCRPSDTFVQIGQNATLLIHESTFDDDKIGDAEAKKHSTISEALDVGRRMCARRILLTHFSQRYAKISLHGDRIVPDGEQQVKDQAVLVAFDQMRVRLGDFRKAEAFLPAIKVLLEAEADD
jgi:ribonuclease Z